jgi:2-polyprenyl-6-methoxyphenol hydroxylase-like FAD-dependent oxidoreductase
MTVAVLDTQAAPRLNPGETLHPGVEPIFRQLGVWDALLECRFHRHRGIWREDGDRRVFESYGRDQLGPWLGLQVDRAKLSEILRKRVANLGGSITRVAHLDGMLKTRGVVSAVRADGRVFDARFVLDATGRHSWLAGKLGLLPEKRFPERRLRFGWSSDRWPELGGQPLFRQRKNGWDWLSPLGDGRCAWVKLRCGRASRGIDYTWRVFRACAGPGYFLLGDAACLMDPSAANGVLRALMSGIYAVHLIDAIRQEGSTPAQAAAEYRRWMEELFDRSSDELQRHSRPHDPGAAAGVPQPEPSQAGLEA